MGTTDWAQMHGVFRVPLDCAPQVDARLSLARPSVGTAWFDEFVVKEVDGDAPTLDTVFVNKYRRRTEGGPAVVRGILRYAPADVGLTAADFTVSLQVLDYLQRPAIGLPSAPAKFSEVEYVTGGHHVTESEFSVTFASAGLPWGDYTVRCTIRSGDGRITGAGQTALTRENKYPTRLLASGLGRQTTRAQKPPYARIDDHRPEVALVLLAVPARACRSAGLGYPWTRRPCSA